MTGMRVQHVVTLLALSLVAVACASPPEAEKKAADSAVAAAQAAEAEKYAPSEFAAMTAAIKKAEAEMSSKAYKEAKASYESARDLAEKAARAAEAGKAAAKAAADKARADAEKQIADLDTRWKELQTRAAVVTRRLKADQKVAWDANGKAIGDALDAARTSLASDLSAAKAKVEAIPAMLDKWEADVAAVATPKPAVTKKPAASKR